MKIAFLTDWNLKTPKLRSGVPYNINKGFYENETECIEVFLSPKRGNILAKLKSKLYQIYFNNIRKQKKGLWDANFEPFKAKSNKQIIKPIIDNEEVDALFSIKVSDFAYTNTSIPKYLWIDNTYDTFINTPHMPKPNNLLYKRIIECEDKSLKNCNLIFTASSWLKEHLIQEYSIAPNKIKVVERGASLIGYNNENELNSDIKNKLETVKKNILFINTHWIRKGGNTVIKTCDLLKEKGFDFTLHIIGNEPPAEVDYKNIEYIKFYGHLHKSKEKELLQFKQIFKESHLLFVPTLADGFGIVYAEAASFGVPSLATDTMGVCNSVINNVTGQRFKLHAEPEEYANYITSLLSDNQKYQELCLSSFNYYQKYFNWIRNTQRVLEYIKETID